HEADDLRSGHPQPSVARTLVTGFESDVQGRDIEVRQINRYLRAAVFGNDPPDCFDRFQETRLPDRLAVRVEDRISVSVALHPPALANVERNARRESLVERVEVDVVRDQKLARANHRRAASRIERRWAAV